jgi:hypothetical protein
MAKQTFLVPQTNFAEGMSVTYIWWKQRDFAVFDCALIFPLENQTHQF